MAGDVWPDVGLPLDAKGAAETALAACRAAQSSWYVASRPRKQEEDEARETAAGKLRSEALSACRFNLREDRGIQGALDRIQEGEGIADLAADCVDLSKLLRDNAPKFLTDKTFDAAAVASKLEEFGVAIAASTSERRAVSGSGALLEARDRAFHVLDEILDEIRAAGRHAFRNTEDVRRFGSAYERRKSRRNRKETPTP